MSNAHPNNDKTPKYRESKEYSEIDRNESRTPAIRGV